MNSLRVRATQGFTLVEVMVSLGAMIIGFVAIWGLHMTALKVDFRSDQETRAALRASEKIEQLRAVALTNFSAVTNGSDNPEGQLQRVWTISGKRWRRNVEVTVSWPEQLKLSPSDKKTVRRSVRMNTVVVNLN